MAFSDHLFEVNSFSWKWLENMCESWTAAVASVEAKQFDSFKVRMLEIHREVNVENDERFSRNSD